MSVSYLAPAVTFHYLPRAAQRPLQRQSGRTNAAVSHGVYLRRRIVVAALLAAILSGLILSARTVLADRGAAPASSFPVRHISTAATAATSVSAAATAELASVNGYIVQPNDTLWSIATRFHGDSALADYVDRLVSAHGSSTLQIGEILPLP